MVCNVDTRARASFQFIRGQNATIGICSRIIILFYNCDYDIITNLHQMVVFYEIANWNRLKHKIPNIPIPKHSPKLNLSEVMVSQDRILLLY